MSKSTTVKLKTQKLRIKKPSVKVVTEINWGDLSLALLGIIVSITLSVFFGFASLYNNACVGITASLIALLILVIILKVTRVRNGAVKLMNWLLNRNK